MKIKYYKLCNIQHYLSAIILFNSILIIVECLKLGRFLQSASDWPVLFDNSTIIYIV